MSESWFLDFYCSAQTLWQHMTDSSATQTNGFFSVLKPYAVPFVFAFAIA